MYDADPWAPARPSCATQHAGQKYGYETAATSSTARPAVVDSPSGAGHAVMLGFNPYYRSWKEQDERLVLNAALYPKGRRCAGRSDAGVRCAGRQGRRHRPRGDSAPRGEAADAGPGPRRQSRLDRDVRIQVKRADGAKLRAAARRPT